MFRNCFCHLKLCIYVLKAVCKENRPHCLYLSLLGLLREYIYSGTAFVIEALDALHLHLRLL